MVDTVTLIEALARDARPVRRLPNPGRRALQWLTLALAVVAMFSVIMGIRPDLAGKLADQAFTLQLIAGLATAGCAALAAFSSVVPGAPNWVLWLPAAPLLVWIGSLGRQCWQDWFAVGPDGLGFRPDPVCLPIIAMIGAVPAIAMVAMVRRGAPLTPRLTVCFGALAAGALAYVGLRLVHPQDAAFMVLIWQFGSVVVFTFAIGLFGRWLLSWRAVTARIRAGSRPIDPG